MSRWSSAVRSKLFLDSSETDLSQLQRQYRSLQRAKRSDTEKAQGLINRVEKCKQPESKELDFEDAIKQILRETGEKDEDTMIRNFKQMEEQNYTLLNCQYNEAYAIQRQISQLCSEREIFLAEQQQQQHQPLRTRVSIKRKAAEQQLAVYQHCAEFMEKLIDQLKEGVKSMLQITNDSLVICDQLGSSDQVQDENIIECLRMVEDRVNELLTLQSYLYLREKFNPTDIDSVSTIGGQLMGITTPAVHVTTAAATASPDDEPDLVESVLLTAKEPVSREELLTLVNERILRRKTTD